MKDGGTKQLRAVKASSTAGRTAVLAALVVVSGAVASMALEGLSEVMAYAHRDAARAPTAQTFTPSLPMPPAVDVVTAPTYADAARGLASAQCERVERTVHAACVRGAKVAFFRALQARTAP